MTADLLVENLAAHWMQSGLLTAVALGAVWLMKLKEPGFRLLASQLILVAIVGLPLLQKWEPQATAVEVASSASASEAASVGSAGGTATDEPRWLVALGPKGVLMLLFLGSVIRLLWLGYGIFRLTRFSSTAAERARPEVASDLESRIGVAPRYVDQMPGGGPCTFGVFRSTIALPRGYDALPPSFQRAIVCHELLHARRRDMAIALVEELVVAILWFHPWLWLLRACIRIAREQVVDRNVVTLVGDREEYVRCLVEVAGHDLTPHLSQAGAGMLRPIELRARIDAIFQEAFMSRRRFAAMTLAFLALVAGTTFVTAAAVPLRAPLAAPEMSQAQSVQTAIAEPPRQATAAYRIGGSVQQPRKIADVPANYPEEAQRAQVEGVVVIEARVDENGNVSNTRLLRSVPLLDQASIEAVSQWKYEPSFIDGERVPVFVTVTVNFSLRNGRPGTFVRLNVTLPEEYRRTPGSVRLLVRAGDMGVVLTRDNMAFAFVPLTSGGSPSEQVRIGVYRVNPDAGPAPQAMGSVAVAVGAGIVQTPTMPSFGVELVSVDTR